MKNIRKKEVCESGPNGPCEKKEKKRCKKQNLKVTPDQM